LMAAPHHTHAQTYVCHGTITGAGRLRQHVVTLGLGSSPCTCAGPPVAGHQQQGPGAGCRGGAGALAWPGHIHSSQEPRGEPRPTSTREAETQLTPPEARPACPAAHLGSTVTITREMRGSVRPAPVALDGQPLIYSTLVRRRRNDGCCSAYNPAANCASPAWHRKEQRPLGGLHNVAAHAQCLVAWYAA
jgi:hypothetical protein